MQKQINPALAIGAIALVIVVVGGYFWYSSQPKPRPPGVGVHWKGPMPKQTFIPKAAEPAP